MEPSWANADMIKGLCLGKLEKKLGKSLSHFSHSETRFAYWVAGISSRNQFYNAVFQFRIRGQERCLVESVKTAQPHAYKCGRICYSS